MDQYSEITGTIIGAAIEVFSLSPPSSPAEREVVIILVCLKRVFSPTIIKNKTVNLKPGLENSLRFRLLAFWHDYANDWQDNEGERAGNVLK
jgi:hypothetical protein